MWQNPSQRIRALANARRRARDRVRFPVHYKRVDADLEITTDSPSNKKIEVRIVLNDLGTKGISIFSPDPIPARQQVVIHTYDPIKITLKGTVVYCQEHNANSHVLTQVHYVYRIGIEFIANDDAEKEAINNFVAEMTKNYLLIAPAA